MIFRIAFKNFIHEPARSLATAAGIGLSVVLVTVQLGLLSGFDRMISGILDHAKADLWIVPIGTAAFDDPSFLEADLKYAAAVVEGVDSVEPLLVGFAGWRKPVGGSTTVIVVGSDPTNGAVEPWNIASGKLGDLRAPDTVAIDSSYAQQLGVDTLGDGAEIDGVRARIAVTTSGIRSFTTSPYIFTTFAHAREFLDSDPSRASYLTVKLSPGADAKLVKQRLEIKLPNVEVLSSGEFRMRNVERWLLDTGAGIALLAGATIAVFVGSMVMTQSLYTTLNDHRREFATFCAMGSSKSFLRSIVVCQAAICTVAGLALALLGNVGVTIVSSVWNLPIEITPVLLLSLCVVASVMSGVAAFVVAAKIGRIDPKLAFAA